MPRKHLLAALAGLSLTLPCASARAQVPPSAEPVQHEVELVVFRRADRGSASEEFPRPAAAATTVPATGSAPREPLASLRLEGVAAALRRTPGTTVLYHGGWRQILGDSDRERVALPVPGLAGSVAVGRERFVHVDVELALTDADGAAVVSAAVRERRRLRLGEVHYLDSPLLGVIVVVRPAASLPEPAAD